MKGDEKRVVDAFCIWLNNNGWSVRRGENFIDIIAKRQNECLYAEAKGRTKAIGLDVDTMYGQLLRRMPGEEVGKARFGVVVPEEARDAALRVPSSIRKLLDITIFVVTSDGEIQIIEAG